MRLEVQSGSLADLDDAAQLYGPTTGDFSSPLITMCWPLDESASLEDHRRRAQWSTEKQIARVKEHPNIRIVKVVDTDAPTGPPQLAALARYRYVDGEKSKNAGASGAADAVAGSAAAEWPAGLKKDYFLAMMSAVMTPPEGAPPPARYWRLEVIMTRAPYRRKGAGALLLQWGFEHAKEDGVPLLLESATRNKAWYESHGFREAGRAEVDVLGETDTVFHMRADL